MSYEEEIVKYLATLQETADLKSDLISMLDKLNQDELSLAHKYVRTFLLK